MFGNSPVWNGLFFLHHTKRFQQFRLESIPRTMKVIGIHIVCVKYWQWFLQIISYHILILIFYTVIQNIRQNGVSVYYPDEAIACFKNKNVSCLQVPYSIFDHRMKDLDVFNKGIESKNNKFCWDIRKFLIYFIKDLFRNIFIKRRYIFL